MLIIIKEIQANERMTEFLRNEFNTGWVLLESNDSQYLRRALIRSLFAAIENVIWGMKLEILNRIKVARISFSEEDLAILKEKSIKYDKEGKSIVSTKYVEFKRNIRFVFESYVKSYGGNLNIDVESKDWKEFVCFVKIRNRITHPKIISDLIISDVEIEITSNVFQ